ncbi:MAG: long-chain fatty acid--CoA ligase, partial [Candidatus Sericytochromatia bacterium]
LTMNRRERFNFDSVGVPYPSVLIKLAEDGEILAQGPNIFQGYYKNPEATAEAFDAAGWFKTGDVGMWTSDGFLKIIDRKKEILVTSGGKNVPPANIEHKFQDNPLIQHLIVYGDGKKYLTALVTLNEEAVRDELGDQATPWDALARSQHVLELVERQVANVNESLASYETIKKVWISPAPLTVEDNLLTSSFKPRRKAIYERYGAELEALYG